MNIFADTITFQITDARCFYFSPHTNKTFKERKDTNKKTKMSLLRG